MKLYKNDNISSEFNEFLTLSDYNHRRETVLTYNFPTKIIADALA